MAYFDAENETLPREKLHDLQLRRVQALLAEILPRNRFYTAKFGRARRVDAWDEFRQLPFTTKQEVGDDQLHSPPFGTNLTYELDRYVKLHQTSGTTGKAPLRVLDTAESWDWWARCWGHVYTAAGVGVGDRVFFA